MELAFTIFQPLNYSLALLLVPSLALFTIASSTFIGWLRKIKKIPLIYTRKIFHLLIFTCAGILQVALHFPAVVLFSLIVLISLVYAIIKNQGFPFYDAMARPFTQKTHRNISIILPAIMTGLGAWLSFLAFQDFFVVGLFICGWGDAAAEIFGIGGIHKYRVPFPSGSNPTKTLEGSFAMFLVGTYAGWIAMMMLGFDWTQALWIGIVASVAGTIAEAISNSYIDNFTIQICASATAYYLTRV